VVKTWPQRGRNVVKRWAEQRSKEFKTSSTDEFEGKQPVKIEFERREKNLINKIAPGHSQSTSFRHFFPALISRAFFDGESVTGCASCSPNLASVMAQGHHDAHVFGD